MAETLAVKYQWKCYVSLVKFFCRNLFVLSHTFIANKLSEV